MSDQDISAALQQQVLKALQNETPLDIRGSGSKTFLGNASPATELPINISMHRGIVEYDPRELVLTARGGTPLTQIESVLTEAGQMLAFEPPHFGNGATLGGTIACALSGPRRPYSGSARDFVLGCKLLNDRA